MNTNAIRAMVEKMEEYGKSIGTDITAHSSYVYINIIVELHEDGEKIPYYERRELRDDLKELCLLLGLNYGKLLNEALAKYPNERK